MMCDVSHGGQVMECPTCFQKIAAPQAPAADGKFILTGTKCRRKKISRALMESSVNPRTTANLASRVVQHQHPVRVIRGRRDGRGLPAAAVSGAVLVAATP